MSTEVQQTLRRFISQLDVDLDAELGPVADATTSCLVRLSFDNEFATRNFDVHPLDALLGFAVPADWRVFGLAAHGWTINPATNERARCRYIVLGAWDGSIETGIRIDGDTIRHGADVGGNLIDVLRRCFGFDTAPADHDTLPMGRTVAMLAAVAALGDTRPVDATDVARIAEQLPRSASWDDLRWAAIDGSVEVPMEPTLCAWMDTGMFARTLLAEGNPQTGRLFALAKAACAPDGWRALLEACCAELDLD